MFFVLISDDMKDSRKMHQCPVCLKMFSKKDVMDLHMSVHKGDPTVEKIKASWKKKIENYLQRNFCPL